MAVITPSQTASLTGVAPLNQGFISNEIEDTYLSHLDLNGFCTIDNSLQGVAGDRRTIYKYTPSGTAVDVAEGAGNSASISVALTGNEYVVKCIQDWFQYSDEAMMRDPFAVQAGINHMGIALFNKVNADVYAEMANATLGNSTAVPFTFDAMVDAVSALTIKDAAGENALDAQKRFVPTVWAIAGKAEVGKIRKACKDQLEYVPEHAWNPGYIGEVAGVTVFYKQDATADTIYVGTNQAVTVFNKTGVQTEIAARAGGATGSANTRMNDIFARKYYIAALTDATQIYKLTIS
jgi:hypothetical protein